MAEKEFNWQKYQLQDTIKKVSLTVEGEELEVGVKPFGYMRKQKLISDCYVYDTGTIGFDHAKYTREALKAIIAEAPWGSTNDIFLVSLGDNALSQALATLVPDAFVVGAQTEELKKD